MVWTRAELEADGFEGFLPFTQLSRAPDLRGVYVVIRTDTQRPTFTSTSTAKQRKGKLGAVPIDVLDKEWIDDCAVVYIGKAGGTGIASTLKTRLEEFRATGAGTSTKHRGGRYIWQLADADQLLVGWKVVLEEEPVVLEGHMIRQFKDDHGGSRPFANGVG